MRPEDAGAITRVGRLPDALVLGVPKAGTTSLAAWIGAHPDAWVPPRKELEFFNAHWDQGLDAYRASFADAGDVAVACEATPDYLLHRLTLQRVAATLPDARFVVLLREPVARAWSHFNYNRQLGIEYRSFRRALADERRDPPRRPLGFGDVDLRVPFSYLGTGRYAEHLARLDELVDPSRTLVRLLDDVRVDPQGTFDDVCEHLGLDPHRVPPEIERANTGRTPRSVVLQNVIARLFMGRSDRTWFRLASANLLDRRPDPLAPDLAQRLRARMQPHNERLAERLGRPLPRSWSVEGR